MTASLIDRSVVNVDTPHPQLPEAREALRKLVLRHWAKRTIFKWKDSCRALCSCFGCANAQYVEKTHVTDEETKIDGQRRAIREHVEKYNRYKVDHEKRFALKTIERAQSEIEALKQKSNKRISSSWEDNWRP